MDMKVNGIAGKIAFGPAPVAVFDDETRIGGQNKIARLTRDELETALLEQWRQRGEKVSVPAIVEYSLDFQVSR